MRAVKQGGAGYSSRALPAKLGISPGTTVALVGAPRGFAGTLGELPNGARLRAGTRVHPGLVIWFVRSSPELVREIQRISSFADGAPLWIAWRKKSALQARGAPRAQKTLPRAERGLQGPSENQVREAGLAAGLVDYKVCAIDATWSGLLFAPRRSTSG